MSLSLSYNLVSRFEFQKKKVSRFETGVRYLQVIRVYGMSFSAARLRLASHLGVDRVVTLISTSAATQSFSQLTLGHLQCG